jgi:hypothetical protein
MSEIAELAHERVLLLVRDGREMPLDTPLETGDQIVMFTARPVSDFSLEAPSLAAIGVR